MKLKSDREIVEAANAVSTTACQRADRDVMLALGLCLLAAISHSRYMKMGLPELIALVIDLDKDMTRLGMVTYNAEGETNAPPLGNDGGMLQ